MNIPIYKAKVKNSNTFVEGLLIRDAVEYCEPDIQKNGLFIQERYSFKGYLRIVSVEEETIEINLGNGFFPLNKGLDIVLTED